HLVGELLRSFAVGLCGTLNFLSVLISTSEEESIESHHALTARNRIASNRCVRVPDVRTRIHVIDGSRYVKLLGHEKSSSVVGRWSSARTQRLSFVLLRVRSLP